MPFPVGPLQQLWVVLVPLPVLLLVGEQRGWPEQRRRVRRQRKAEVRALTPVRDSVEKRAPLPDIRDVFLCHAWADRREAAKERHDLLESRGVSVWFSEKDVALGMPLLREIDRGLAKSRVGIVLVTPVLLRRLEAEGIADKELSAPLARDLLVPIVHNTTYEALREVSPCSAREAA